MVTTSFGDTDRLPSDPLLERLRLATRGSYDVAGELGRGGMAVVYVGTDRQLERRVAIKVMDPRLSMTQGMAARFLQEARIAARLQHPNIIVVHDVRQSDEIIFFVMSLIDGVAVDDLCRHAQPIPIDQIRWILFQATRALAYAHSEDIVHRDIKPANILLNLKGEVILTDFGIAKALGDTGLTQTGTQVGTPMYMSPEQFSGVPVGPSSDQYALGITAYQLITGQPPFTGDLYQLITAHGNKAPVPVRDVRPDCPAFLANAVMRMLEKNPEDRWPSLEDLQDVFGANMAMDGGLARRKLSETVRSLHRGGSPTTGGASDSGRRDLPIGERTHDSVVVTISPPGATIFVSGTLDLRASVSMDTGQSLPGAGVQWTSSDESVLFVHTNGTVTGVAPGTAVVRAAVNGGTSEATIRVEAAPIARLSLTAPSLTLRVGDVTRPDVVAVDVNGAACDGITMAWISRSPAVADLDAPGVIRAISPGLAVIDVSTGNVRRSIDVAVLRRPIAQLRLGAPSRTMQLGETATLSIEAFDDLGERTDAVPARWTSSAPSVIHVDSTGRALAIASGVARISASVDEAADSVELESLEPPIGALQFTLTDDTVELGDEVTWSLRVKDVTGAARSAAGVRIWSSDPNVLMVDESGTRARAVHMGEALLYAAPDDPATSLAPVSAQVRVTDVVVARLDVFPATLDIEVGAVAAVNVQGVDRRGVQVMSTDVAWQVDATDIAVVEGRGTVRALAPGACTIRARVVNADGSVAEASIALRVRRASVARLSITADRSMLEVGESMPLRATTWDAMDVEVQDAAPTWRSTQPAVARVDAQGVLFALAPGRATITAELDGKSGQISVLIAPSAVESLTLEPVTTELIVGQTIPLTVIALDRNGQSVAPPVRWLVEPPEAGTIGASGHLTVKRAGSLTVRASLSAPSDATGILAARNPLDATMALRARDPRVLSLQFAASVVSLPAGRVASADIRIAADAGVAVPASSLVWSSSNPEVVRVDEAGQLRAVAPGDATVSAVAVADAQRAVLTVHVTAASVSKRTQIPLLAGTAVVAVAALAWAFWPAGDPTAGGADSTTVATTPDTSPTLIAPAADGGSALPDNGAGPTVETAIASAERRADSAAEVTSGGDVPSRETTTRPPATSPTRDDNAAARRAIDSARRVATTRGREAGSAARPPASPPGYVTPPTANVPPPTTRTAVPESTMSRASGTPPATVTTPPASTTGAAPVESPNAADLRTIASRIAADVSSGRLRPSPDLVRFFADGAEHKVSVGTTPAGAPSADGRVRTQFELSLSRYNAGGARENRVTVVRIEVAKRGGTPELISTEFGPVKRPGS